MSVRHGVHRAEKNKNMEKEWGSQKRKEREEEFLRDIKHFDASPVLIQTLLKIRAGVFSRANSKTRDSVNQRKFTEHRKVHFSMSNSILPLENCCRGAVEAHITDQLWVSLHCCIIKRKMKAIFRLNWLECTSWIFSRIYYLSKLFLWYSWICPIDIHSSNQQAEDKKTTRNCQISRNRNR